jgi:hypothetical protein
MKPDGGCTGDGLDTNEAFLTTINVDKEVTIKRR